MPTMPVISPGPLTSKSITCSDLLDAVSLYGSVTPDACRPFDALVYPAHTLNSVTVFVSVNVRAFWFSDLVLVSS